MEGDRRTSLIKNGIRLGLAVAIAGATVGCARESGVKDALAVDNKPALTAPLPDNARVQKEIAIPTLSVTQRATEFPIPTKIATTSPTEEPTRTPENVVFRGEREHLKSVMEKYGYVDQEKLSDTYWNRVKERIEKYGEAKRIVAFEFHGDNYSMYGGTYSMTPLSFERQMRFLMENDYHFVTGAEIVGYVDGWLKLPARSVILTTDSGATSMESLPRMTALADKLKSEYGYAPHYNSYIWTKDMTADESIRCLDDKCWEGFRSALKSGYFSLGTHTESHDDFAEYSFEKGIADLEQSRREIKENLGITVNGISWPFESSPEWMNKLKDYGFVYGYGGRSRSLEQGYTYPKDNLAMSLPRILPPNPSGVSGRPDGQTLEQILGRMKDFYSPLKLGN